MVAAINTIKKNKEYRRIYKHGKAVADRNIVLFSLVNNLQSCRFGFTASKKIGNAVIRNRIRRLFREACRLNLEKFQKGFDYVLMARYSIVGVNYQQVEESLLKLLVSINNNRSKA